MVVEGIFAAFARHGEARYGENVSQLQHALQSAELARLDSAADTLIVAALLHDFGQFIDGAGDAGELRQRDGRHEDLGSAWLARYFAASVAEPVRLHVAAKRYLASTRLGYIGTLSAASRLSLSLQGGPMTPPEIAEFERNRFFEAAIRLRHYDDGGKRANWDVPSLDTYRPLLIQLSAGSRRPASLPLAALRQ